MKKVGYITMDNLHKYSKPVYIISIAAELVGVHPRTLRIYEEMGFIKPWRTKRNVRLFSQEDVYHIKKVCDLIHQRGLNLAGIKMLMKISQSFHRDFYDFIEEII
jgi:MerR family transcriptional regulator/heat shock protein HspR